MEATHTHNTSRLKWSLLILVTFLFSRIDILGSYNIVFPYLQFMVVLTLLVFGSTNTALKVHVIFMLAALEFSLGEDYSVHSYRSVQFMGISLSTLMFFFIYLVRVKQSHNPFRVDSRIKLIFLGLIIATFMGLNGLSSHQYVKSAFIGDLQYWVVLFVSFHLFYLSFLHKTSDSREHLYILMMSIAISAYIQFTGSLFEIVGGNYGGVDIFSFDTLGILSATILLFISRNNSLTLNIFLLVSQILSFLTMYTYQASGKGIMLYGIVIILAFYRNVIYGARLNIGRLLLMGAITLLVSIPISKSTQGQLFQYKFYSVKQLVTLKWVSNPMLLAPSTRDRVLEFMNVSYYLNDHTLRGLLGTGFGGYYEEDFQVNPTANAQGGYSDIEIDTRRFSNPHSSVNSVLLKFGILGLVFWASLMVKIVRTKATLTEAFAAKTILFILIGLSLGYSIKLAIVTGMAFNIYLAFARQNGQGTLELQNG